MTTTANSHSDKPCPNCGYCPSCGRRNASPYPVWVYPYTTYPYTGPYWSSPTNTTVTYGQNVC